MRASTLVRLAVSGTRTDTVRLALTAFGAAIATLGWLCAATVASLGFAGADLGSNAYDMRYSSALLQEPGLRPGVVATFVLLTIPVMALVAQCSRLGAPARDRRIAAIRLAGATPRQAVAIGAGESAASALVGSAIGVGVYFVLRQVLDHVNARGERSLPTDVLPNAVAIVAIAIVMPAVVAFTSAFLLRRVTTSPLGVVRRVRRRRAPRPWPGVLIVIGVGLFAVIDPLTRLLAGHGVHLSGTATVSIFYVGVLAAMLGVALGAGWISYTAGVLLRRLGRSAAAQLAAARLTADPWDGSRTFGVLIVAAAVGGATAAAYQHFATMAAAERAVNVALGMSFAPGPPDTSYTSATRLVGIAVGVAVLIAALGQLVSVTEAIVSRRRAYAALVATGVPRGVLVRTQVWQSLVVAIPSFVLAVASGVLIVRGLFGTKVVAPGTTFMDGGRSIRVPDVTRTVPLPWSSVFMVIGGSIAAVLLTVAIGVLFLRTSTSVDELRTA